MLKIALYIPKNEIIIFYKMKDQDENTEGI